MNKLTTFHTQSYADMINRIGLGLSVSDNMEEMRKESTVFCYLIVREGH